MEKRLTIPGSAFTALGLALTYLVSALSACSASSTPESNDAQQLDPGVSLGGAQDFGQFRKILELGQVPDPSTLDELGFFNEHKIALPPAECGQPICMQVLVGTTANLINGNNCTMAFVAFNTKIDPETAVRPPLHLALALDTSGSMAGDRLAFLKLGLQRLLDGLAPNDRVTLIPFGSTANPGNFASSASDPALRDSILNLRAEGATNIYDGLRRAYEAATTTELPGYQQRVILLSDGQSNVGVQEDARILRLARAYADVGISTSSIGVGTEIDPHLVRAVAQAGAGAFYFAQDPAAVEEIFAEEAEAFLIPLADDGVLSLTATSGYHLRAVYGSDQGQHDLLGAELSFPRLQLAHRQSVHPDSGGRRGGGGALIFEFLPTTTATNALANISFSYIDPATQQALEQSSSLLLPFVPAEQGKDAFFTDAGAQKAFVMLNIYAGLKMAAQSAAQGNINEALGVLDALSVGVNGWLTTNLDGDIQDDLHYVDLFREVLRNLAVPGSTPAGDPWPAD